MRNLIPLAMALAVAGCATLAPAPAVDGASRSAPPVTAWPTALELDAQNDLFSPLVEAWLRASDRPDAAPSRKLAGGAP